TVLEVGGTKSLVDGYVAPPVTLEQNWAYVAFTMLLGGSALSLCVRRKYQRGESLLIWWLIGQFVVAALVWLLYDRYALIYIPAIVVLVLVGRAIIRPAAAIALICVFAAHSLVGTRDDLEYNRALWSAVDYLRQNRVPDSEIGGSYMIQGWLQYAHPENARHDADGRTQVVGFTAKGELRYAVKNAPIPGFRTMKEIPYRQWLAQSGSVYAVERTGATVDEH